jgi:branched-chain amino acid transport system permease protein
MAFEYIVTLLTIATIYAIVASSLNFVTGYTGQVSLGHAAFLAVGAYTEALLIVKLNLPFLVAFPAAIVMSGILGALLGLPSLRVSDDFLAVATIGINFIMVAALKFVSFTNGTRGIGPIPTPRLFGLSLDGAAFFGFTLVALAFTVATAWWITHSWVGLAFAAVREDSQAAASISISPARFKIIAFAISGMFAGVAGALYAHYFQFITPGNFVFIVSVDILVFAVFGGLGTIWGPVVGAYFLYLLPQMLRIFEEYRLILYGIVLLFIIIIEPDGLMGLKNQFTANVKKRRDAPTRGHKE